MPGKSKKGGGLESSPVYKKMKPSGFKMKYKHSDFPFKSSPVKGVIADPDFDPHNRAGLEEMGAISPAPGITPGGGVGAHSHSEFGTSDAMQPGIGQPQNKLNLAKNTQYTPPQ